MSRKAFLLQVELDVQAVTCPGVWLCTNGKVSLQIYMLDSCVQTASFKPTFPIQMNETFVFYKTFYANHRLNDLQKELRKNWIYIELVQWRSCELGNVLASFKTTLDELLYPSMRGGAYAGVDLDVLMDPTDKFPGTIGPKVEISTKTTIEETLCSCDRDSSTTVVVNPKVLAPARRKQGQNNCRKVCHSVAFSKRDKQLESRGRRPPFRYRKAEDDLILRKPQYDLENEICRCRRSQSLERDMPKNLSVRKRIRQDTKSCPCTVRFCACGSGHRLDACPTCAKYEGYFDSPRSGRLKFRSKLFEADNKVCSAKRTTGQKETQTLCKCCDCCEINTQRSLAQRLHTKLTETLNSLPRSMDCISGEDNQHCEICDCPVESGAGTCGNLQKFYREFCRKTRDNCCVPDCPRSVY